MSKNYQSLFSLRLLKSIIGIFTSNFLVLYFLELNNQNILPLGIYYIVVYLTIFLTIFFVRNICKTKRRIYLLRIGILLNFVYFLLLAILKEKIISYVWLIGLVYGLEEGFYYSIYNNFESTGISNEERAKFIGSYTAWNAILGMLIPIFFGSLISAEGFGRAVIVVLILVMFQIACSLIFKDSHIPRADKTDLRGYRKLVERKTCVQKSYLLSIFEGFIYNGAFNSIVTVYIIKVFSNSFELGIFTALFSLVTCICGILFAKKVKEQDYQKLLKFSTFFMITGIIFIMIACNTFTIILFNFFLVFSKSLMTLINEKNKFDITNLSEIKNRYKEEYFLGVEGSLMIGRIMSYGIFILLSFATTVEETNLILVIFMLVIFCLGAASIALNKERRVQENKNHSISKNMLKE